MKMIRLYSPRDLGELSLIESILKGESIPYFIHNNHFGSLEVGPQIDIYNKKTIMVAEEDEERAKELISDFIKTTRDETTKIQPYSWFDKVRIILEALLFTWFMPGRHRKRLQNGKDET
jgi:hypothetical protein